MPYRQIELRIKNFELRKNQTAILKDGNNEIKITLLESGLYGPPTGAETSERAVETARKIIRLREHGIKQIAKLGRSTEKGMTLYNYLFQTPMIRVKDVERIFNMKNPNALALVSKFVELGILRELTGFKRNRVFSFADYIALFE